MLDGRFAVHVKLAGVNRREIRVKGAAIRRRGRGLRGFALPLGGQGCQFAGVYDCGGCIAGGRKVARAGGNAGGRCRMVAARVCVCKYARIRLLRVVFSTPRGARRVLKCESKWHTWFVMVKVTCAIMTLYKKKGVK